MSFKVNITVYKSLLCYLLATYFAPTNYHRSSMPNKITCGYLPDHIFLCTKYIFHFYALQSTITFPNVYPSTNGVSDQQEKHNFRLLIFLLIYLNLLYVFRATNSHIFRSTFDCIHSFGLMRQYCCRWVTRFHLNPVTHRQQYRCIVPKLYMVKSTIEDGRVCCPKHVQQIKIDQ